MTRVRAFAAAAMAALAATGLAACDSEELGRELNYKKGVYLGPKDPPLSAETMEALRQRTHLQSGTTVASGGGGPTRFDGDVRPPTTPGTNLEALRSRGALQRAP